MVSPKETPQRVFGEPDGDVMSARCARTFAQLIEHQTQRLLDLHSPSSFKELNNRQMEALTHLEMVGVIVQCDIVARMRPEAANLILDSTLTFCVEAPLADSVRPAAGTLLAKIGVLS